MHACAAPAWVAVFHAGNVVPMRSRSRQSRPGRARSRGRRSQRRVGGAGDVHHVRHVPRPPVEADSRPRGPHRRVVRDEGPGFRRRRGEHRGRSDGAAGSWHAPDARSSSARSSALDDPLPGLRSATATMCVRERSGVAFGPGHRELPCARPVTRYPPPRPGLGTRDLLAAGEGGARRRPAVRCRPLRLRGR